MIWDTRVWSFFVWIVATALFLTGFATPYDMPGNRINIKIAFGGDVIPGGSRIGLWKEVPAELTGSITAVRAMMCVSIVCIAVSMIMYFLLFKRANTVLQIVAFIAQLLAGVFALIGIGIYRGASDQLGEGFYFCAMSGALFIVNGIVLVFMPWMEYQVPQWKIPEAVPLTSTKA